MVGYFNSPRLCDLDTINRIKHEVEIDGDVDAYRMGKFDMLMALELV